MPALSRLTVSAALVGGAAWVTKALVITALDAYFDPMESVLFLTGLVLAVVAAFSLGRDLTARFSGAARWGTTVLAGLLVVGLGTGLMGLGDVLSARLYHGTNVGITMESGVFALGLAWLMVGLAGLAKRRGAKPAITVGPATVSVR